MNRYTLAVSAAVLAIGTVCLQAQEPSGSGSSTNAEQRLLRLEGELRALRGELGLDQPGRPAFVRALGKESSLKLGGMIQAQADGGDRGDKRWASDHDRFYLRRARLNAGGDLMDGFDCKVELEMAGTLGEQSGLRAQLTDGYVTWKACAPACVRVGQFKTPYGFEQLASDSTLFSVERSMANDRLTMGRQVGFQVGGDVLARRLCYAAGMFDGASSNSSGNDNDKFLYAGRVGTTPVRTDVGGLPVRLSMGGGAFTSEDNSGGQPAEFGFASTSTGKVDNVFVGERNGWAADLQLGAGPFDVWAEYLRTTYKPDSGRPADDFEADGWYVQASCYVLPSKLQAVAKYETYDPNGDADADETDTWTFGLNYYLRGNDLKIQADYLRSDIAGGDGTDDKFIARLQAMF